MVYSWFLLVLILSCWRVYIAGNKYSGSGFGFERYGTEWQWVWVARRFILDAIRSELMAGIGVY